MYTHNSLDAESKFAGIGSVVAKLFPVWKVFAEEEPEPTPAPTQPINYENLIAQARKEEKDKLYPRIKKLEEDNAALVKTGNDNLIKIGVLTEEIEKLRQKLASAHTDADFKALEQKVADLTAELEEAKKIPKESDIRAQLEAEFEMKKYILEQTEANKGKIVSTLLSSITGTTKEEVDAAIKSARETTITIRKELGLSEDDDDDSDEDDDTLNPPPKAPVKKPAQSPRRAPATAPSMDKKIDKYTAEDIRNLDPKSPEYAALRAKMGLR